MSSDIDARECYEELHVVIAGAHLKQRGVDELNLLVDRFDDSQITFDGQPDGRLQVEIREPLQPLGREEPAPGGFDETLAESSLDDHGS